MPLVSGALGFWNKMLFGTIIANTAISMIEGITNIVMASSSQQNHDSQDIDSIKIETINVDMSTIVGPKIPYMNIYYLNS